MIRSDNVRAVVSRLVQRMLFFEPADRTDDLRRWNSSMNCSTSTSSEGSWRLTTDRRRSSFSDLGFRTLVSPPNFSFQFQNLSSVVFRIVFMIFAKLSQRFFSKQVISWFQCASGRTRARMIRIFFHLSLWKMIKILRCYEIITQTKERLVTSIEHEQSEIATLDHLGLRNLPFATNLHIN